MHARIGSNDDGVVEIGREQILVFRIAEGKIDQTIVGKIDWLSLCKQLTTLVSELTAIHNHRVDGVLLEESLSQQKLRIKILVCRPVVDDCNPPGSALPFLELPLMLEHAHDRQLKIVSLCPAQRNFDFYAASSLSLGQQRIQESTASVGVYLDQPGTLCGKMEVVAHEYANRSEIMSSDLGSPGQDRLPIAGQSGRGLDRVYDPKHFADIGF